MPPTFSAKEPLFHYQGRVDRSRPDGVSLIWQSSTVSAGFTGEKLDLLFAYAEGQNYFDLTVNGVVSVIEVPAGKNRVVSVPVTPNRGAISSFTLAKRTEAAAGWVVLSGVNLGPGAHLEKSAAPSSQWRFQFFGDSITAGACNEDGAEDQWETRRTHNGLKSYAAFTASAFQADLRNVSVSGMGIVTGYVPFTASQIWDRLYPSPTSPRADLTEWTPDVVFVNYGENDTSFTKNQGQPFPASFSSGYVSLIHSIRGAYPNAEIVLLRGGMSGGATDPHLRAAWEAAVARLETEDRRIAHFVFQHYSLPHPRVADDRAMADELVAWLKQQPFMAHKP